MKSIGVSSKPLSFCLNNRFSIAENQQKQRFLAINQRTHSSKVSSTTPPLCNNDDAILRRKMVEGRKISTVCSAVPLSTARNLQWISTIASVVLMLAKGTAVNKSLIVPLLALQAPVAVVSWVKGEYGVWAAFMALLVRLFFAIPGELELPFTALLLVILAPYQVLNLRCVDYELNTPNTLFSFTLFFSLYHIRLSRLQIDRGTQEGAIISMTIAAYLAFQHFSQDGNMQKSFEQGSIVSTAAIVSIAVASCLLLI
ncbi:Cold-regulated 413 inner membrane protein 2, chloroplastic [Linum perenne]